MGTGEFNAGDHSAIDQHPIQGEWKYTWLFHARETGDKHWSDGPFGSYADFTTNVRTRALSELFLDNPNHEVNP